MTQVRRLEPGLKLRMKREGRRIADQHRQLLKLRNRVTAEIARPSVPGARAAFSEFAEALEAHFGVEERIYFPAVRGLDKELRAAVDALVVEHRELRLRVTDLTAGFESGNGFVCLIKLESLIDQLKHHERREEDLIALASEVPT